MHTRFSQLLTAGLLSAGLPLGLMATAASAAPLAPAATSASQHPALKALPAHLPYPAYIPGTVEASPVLNIRSSPDTSQSPIGMIDYGATIYIACYTFGQTVSATWGGYTWKTDVWDGLWDGSTGGFNGAYVSDAWVNTGGNTANFVGPCG